MWPISPVDPIAAAVAAAESYAFYTALASIPLILISIGVFLFVRNEVRASALAAATLCVHPVWTVTETWYDNGLTLRVTSTLWIFVGAAAFFSALLSVRRHGIGRRAWPSLRFTSRSLLGIIAIVAAFLVLTRPPISDLIPVTQSLPAIGLMFMLAIALDAPVAARRRARPTRIEIPLRRAAACEPPDHSVRKP